MESAFLTFILVSSFAVYSSHFSEAGSPSKWDDVVVAREGEGITLVCTSPPMRGAIVINWKALKARDWKLVLSANAGGAFSGSASRESMQLIDPNFQNTGVFSLSFIPKKEDYGFYSCMIKQQERKVTEKIILLVILTVIIGPSSTIPPTFTLRLFASVNPDLVNSTITWTAPDDTSIRTEKIPNRGTVAKLPQVGSSDNGTYVCMVHPLGNSNDRPFTFNVDVTVGANKMVSSGSNTTHGPNITTATQAQTPLPLICPDVQGDYVQLYWQPTEPRKQKSMKLVYKYDRWRGSKNFTEHSKKVQLAGPPYNAEDGSFSFILTPEVKDGGLYVCDVHVNDNIIRQGTILSVLKVKTSLRPSKLELLCVYSERSIVKSAKWKYQNKNPKIVVSSGAPGSITITLPLPITSDIAGNYTCIIQLRNGQTFWATQNVTVPSEDATNGSRQRQNTCSERVSVTTPSLLPSLSALLLLVPLVAAAVGVLLWRQKHISDRGIDQSLSVHPSESENIYENPEDMRQAPPQDSVYMDLKPRAEDDVYKELERSEQCQS